MKRAIVFSIIFITLLFIVGCNTTTSNKNNIISGKVVYNNGCEAVDSAIIYIYTNQKDLVDSGYFLSKQITTNSKGEYSFEYSTKYNYKLYSEIKSNGSNTHCSDNIFVNTSDNYFPILAEDMVLFEINNILNQLIKRSIGNYLKW